MKKYTIEDLKEGRVAVKHDGTLDELREVLNKAFYDPGLIGCFKYYYKFGDDLLRADSIITHLPVQSVKDFLEETFEFGEAVEASDNNRVWNSYVFIAKIDSEYPFVVAKYKYEGRCKDDLQEGCAIDVELFPYRFCRKAKANLNITVTLNGKEVSPSEISEETWKNLRK